LTRAWRLCRAPFADLNGDGARRFGGRWNSPGRAVVYTAENPALAILEVRVHLDLAPDLIPDDYVLMEIELGAVAMASLGGASMERVMEQPRQAGDAWLGLGKEPVLRVPSFVAPFSGNFLLNPAHPDMTAVSVVAVRPFSFDRRLWLPLV
jgi:RES domain-containing protein